MALSRAASGRGQEAAPTTGVAWARSAVDATIAVASAGGIGIGLIAITMLVLVIGYPGLAENADITRGSLHLLGVSAATVALFSVLLGPAFTVHALALIRMYRGLPAKSIELRKVIEFRGQVSRQPLFPLMVSLVCVGFAAALAAIPAVIIGIEYAQRGDDPETARSAILLFGATAACGAVVIASLVGVLICRRFQKTRLSSTLGALPAQAVGHAGPRRQRVRGDDKPKLTQLTADNRRLRTGTGRIQVVGFLALAIGLLGICLTGSIRASPETASTGLALLANGAELLTVVSTALLLAVHIARWVELLHLPERIRRHHPAASALDRRRARALTSDLQAQMWQSLMLWSLLGIALAGLFLAYGGPLQFALGVLIWWLGLTVLVYLRVRLERSGPILREEFGYEIPVEVSTGDSGTAGW